MSKSAFSVKSVLLIKREDKTVGQKTKGSQYFIWRAEGSNFILKKIWEKTAMYYREFTDCPSCNIYLIGLKVGIKRVYGDTYC